MPAVETAPTATAGQTRAAGSRMLGYYMDGLVKVDCVFGTANFLTKDDDGRYRIGVDGTAANPALAFENDLDTGLYRVGADSIGFAVGGALAAHFNAQGRLVVGAGTANYRANVAEANPSRGIVADIANTHASPNGAMLSFTQNGINNWCIGQVPGVDAFAVYRGRNGAADGSEMLRVTSAGSVGIGTSSPSYKLQAMDSSALMLGLFRDYDVVAGGPAGTFIDVGARAGSAPTVAARLFVVLADANEGSLTISTRTAGSMVDRLVFETTGTVRPGSDNSQSLGSASYRWSVVYAGTGAINTSDARDKMWRGASTEAELRAARRIAGELGFFQWNDAIAAKGADGARYHFGVRAQAVWAIMAEEGLVEPIGQGADPTSRYAFLCWDKWDAIEPVDAVDEVLDEEGRVIAEARPAQPGRDAGERFGVRTDQLALFLIAAQEARIAALEAAV